MGNTARKLRRNLMRKHIGRQSTTQNRPENRTEPTPETRSDHDRRTISVEDLGSIARRLSLDFAEKSTRVLTETIPAINRNFLSILPIFGRFSALRLLSPDDERFDLTGRRLYAAPQKIDKWIAENSPLDEYTSSALEQIAGVPSAVWMHNSVSVPQEAMKVAYKSKAQNSLYQVVLCNAPSRNENNDLRGRMAYLRYVRSIARALSNSEGIVVLEPGYLVKASTRSLEEREFLTDILSSAVHILSRYSPSARVYIDAGTPKDLTPAICSMMLKMSGVLMARGFAVNVGSTVSTLTCISYAQKIREILGDTVSFIVDTSKNGMGGENEGIVKIGEAPKTTFSSDDCAMKGADALLWISNPGERNTDRDVNVDMDQKAFCPREAVRLVHDEHEDYPESSPSDDESLHDALS